LHHFCRSLGRPRGSRGRMLFQRSTSSCRLVSVAHQTRRDRVAVGMVVDQHAAEVVVAGLRIERSEKGAKVGILRLAHPTPHPKSRPGSSHRQPVSASQRAASGRLMCGAELEPRLDPLQGRASLPSRVVGTSSPGVERRSHERPHTDAGAHAHADAGAGATTARAGPGEPAGVTLRTSTAGPNLPGAGNQAGGGPPGGAPHARRTGGVRLERSSSPYTSTPRSTSLRFRGVFSGRAQRSRRRSKEPIPSGPLPKGLRSTGAHRGGKVYPWRCDTP
jgi:hypothetical protein